MPDEPNLGPTEPGTWSAPSTLAELTSGGAKLEGCTELTAGAEWQKHAAQARTALAGKPATNQAPGGVGTCLGDQYAWKILYDLDRRPRGRRAGDWGQRQRARPR
eukprot:gene25291-22681_t